MNATLTGDGKADVYVDGKLMNPLNTGGWNVGKKYILPADFKVLAVEITNTKGLIGFKGIFGNGVYTQSGAGWKCADSKPSRRWKLFSYDDSKMNAAKAYKGKDAKGIDSRAYWIYASKKNAKKAFCRRVFRKGLPKNKCSLSAL